MRTIDIMYPLLFTTATGALVTILWFVAGKLLERMGFLHITYRLLKLLMFFWIVPIAYVILSKLNSHGYRWYGDLFCPTGFQIRVGRLFVIIWGIGVLVALGFYIVERIRLKKRMMLARPCDDEETRELYIQVCRELNLKPQKVRLCLSEYEKTPIVAGVWHPIVVLPARHYERAELLVIFRHELTHIKQHDLLVKRLAYIMAVVHAVNPVAWWYVRLVNLWSEYACDYTVCRRMGTMKGYYETLLSMMQEKVSVSGMASGLIERKSEMRKRVEHVKKSYKARTRSKVIVALVAFCLFMGSAGTVCMAAVAAADVAAEVSRQTEVLIEKERIVRTEYVTPASADEGVEIIYASDEADAASLLSDGSADISWELTPGVKMIGGAFYAKQGQRVTVSVDIAPAGKTVQVGLVKPNGDSWYVIGQKSIDEVFRITESGNYRFFIRNTSNDVVNATGSYYLN